MILLPVKQKKVSWVEGSVLIQKIVLGHRRSSATNRLGKCHPTAEQEAVATWPIRKTQLTGYLQKALIKVDVDRHG
jgi:hypothetical protein